MAKATARIEGKETVSKAAKKAEQGLTGLHKQVNKGKKFLSDHAVAIGAVVAGMYVLYRGVQDCIRAYQEQEMAEAKLQAAIRATGKEGEISIDHLKDYASELQNVTTYGDEATLSALSMLQQLSDLSEEGLIKVIPLVQDFASAMDVDLETAASLVGKTLGSTTNALSRYGIVIDATAPKEQKLVELTEALDEKFGGMSKTLAETSLGSMKQLTNAFGDLQEAAGESIAEGIKPVTQWLTQVIQKAADSVKEMNDLNEAFELLGKIAKGEKSDLDEMIASREVLMKQLETQEGLLGELTLAQKDVEAAVAGVTGIEAQRETQIKEGIVALSQQIKWLDYQMKVTKDLTAAEAKRDKAKADQAAKEKSNFEFVKEIYDKTEQAEKDLLQATIARVEAIGGANEAYQEMKRTVLEYLQTQLEGFEEEKEAIEGVTAAYYDQIDVVTANLDLARELSDEYERQKDLLEELKNKQFDLQASFENLQMSGKDWSDFLASTLVDAYADSFQAIGQAIVDAEEGWKSLKEVAKNTIAAILTMMSKQLFIRAGVLFALFRPGPAVAALAASAAAAIAAGYVKGLAKGGTFETRGPTLFVAGDNPGGRERVTATPVSSPNIAGPSETLELWLNFDGEIIHKIVNRGIRDRKIHVNVTD